MMMIIIIGRKEKESKKDEQISGLKI